MTATVTKSVKIKFDIMPDHLAQLVDKVAPMTAGPNEYSDYAKCIRWRADGSKITASATDRYIAGFSVTELPHPVDPFDVALRVTDLRQARKLYRLPRFGREGLPITVEVGVDTVTLLQAKADPMITLQLPIIATKWPPIDGLMADWLKLEPAPQAHIPLAPEYLRKFSHLGRVIEIRFVMYKDSPMTLVFADGFAGALMSNRGERSNPQYWATQWEQNGSLS